MAWLKGVSTKFFGKPGTLGVPHENYPVFPENDLAIIGDIHGRVDLLERLSIIVQNEAPTANLVFVGDYIDRGPSSRQVLEFLQSMDASVIFLQGNHESMLLDFIDRPLENGRRWLRNGGSETLASYGISLDENSSVNSVQRAREELVDQLSNGTETWLRTLPKFWQSGNLVITHAGPDPKKSIQDQDDMSFLWGHNRFFRDTRTDGIWIAHGHWIQDRPKCCDGRISVDTGAYYSGKLTAAIVTRDGLVTFLST